jgi:hypothetical protein
VTVAPIKTGLRRTLAHIIDFGAAAYEVPSAVQTRHKLSERLQPGAVQRQVRYRTPCSVNAWGCRRLTISELGIAFGIPSYFRTAVEHATLFPLVPLQILDEILSALMDTRVVAPSFIAKVARAAIPAPLTKTWLPTLQKFLSHEWIDLEKITDDAAKRDDAAAPVSLWNRRISLVLPCTDDNLDGWRRLLL